MDPQSRFAYGPRLGAKDQDEPPQEPHAVGESQATQLVAFVMAMTGLLLALEAGLRRARRRR
jgi:hypothetical protein